MPRHNTTLDQSTVATLRAYGGGNLSQGIRRAAELVKATEAITLASGDFADFVDACSQDAPRNEKLSEALKRRIEQRKKEEK